MLMSGSLPATNSPPFSFHGSWHPISLCSLQWLLHLWALFKDWGCPGFLPVQPGVVSQNIFFRSISAAATCVSLQTPGCISDCLRESATSWLLGISTLVCARPNEFLSLASSPNLVPFLLYLSQYMESQPNRKFQCYFIFDI